MVFFNLQPQENRDWFNYLFYYDPSAPIKIGVMYGMVPSVIMSLGTERHLKHLDEMFEGKVRTR